MRTRPDTLVALPCPSLARPFTTTAAPYGQRCRPLLLCPLFPVRLPCLLCGTLSPRENSLHRVSLRSPQSSLRSLRLRARLSFESSSSHSPWLAGVCIFAP